LDKYRVAVIGATGLVGRTLIKMLASHPFFELDGVYASESSRGYSISNISPSYVKNLIVERSDVSLINSKKFDLVFSAISEKNAALIERQLSENGNVVITNASGNRMEPDVPIVIPEINGKLLTEHKGNGKIIANGNCSTIGLSFGIAPLLGYGINSVDVTTLQAVSGAGYPGVPSMDILSNVIPFIENEESKMINETSKIFRPFYTERNMFEVTATCNRVPVENGHVEAITITTEEEPDSVEDIYRSFRGVNLPAGLPTLPEKPIIVFKEPDRPQPKLDSMLPESDGKRGMSIAVGRIRKFKKRVMVVLLVNNLIRGAAGSTLLNAELAVKSGVV